MNKVYILITAEEARVTVDGTYFVEDKNIGCYSSRKAAERAGENLGDISWRIEEHDVLSLKQWRTKMNYERIYETLMARVTEDAKKASVNISHYPYVAGFTSSALMSALSLMNEEQLKSFASIYIRNPEES